MASRSIFDWRIAKSFRLHHFLRKETILDHQSEVHDIVKGRKLGGEGEGKKCIEIFGHLRTSPRLISLLF